MTLQLDVQTRNAMLDAIESSNGASCALEIRTGAPPANCGTANSGSILATINLPADWMGDASNGSKAIAGTWQDASADGSGVAGHFRIFRNQATKDQTTCFMQGTITATSGGGDMELDNTNLAAGQQFSITTFTLNDPNI